MPVYFVLVPDANALGGDKFPAPSALVWMGVAKVLSKGLSTLPPGAVWAVGVAFAAGVIIVVVDPRLSQGQALHALAGGAGHRPDYPRVHQFRHVPRRT